MGRSVRGVVALLLVIVFTLAACTDSAEPSGQVSAPSAAGPSLGRTSVDSPDGWPGSVAVSAPDLDNAEVADLGWWLDAGLIVGTPFEVTADAPLPGEGVVISRYYPVPLGVEMAATLAFFNEDARAWQAVPSEISADRRTVTARVNHLSLWTDFMSGSRQTLADFQSRAGSAVRSGGQAVAGMATWTQQQFTDAADWMFYAVGKVFDTRVDGPVCDSETPDWVSSVVHIADHRNNSIHFCTGHDGNDPDLLVVKARVNRGFAFPATIAAETAWRYNSSDPDGLWDAVIPWVTTTDTAFRDALFEIAGGDPRLLVGAGQELSLGVTEAEVRAMSSPDLLTLDPPGLSTFVTSVIGQLMMQAGMNMDESSLSALIAMAGCASDIGAVDTSDPLTVSTAALTCLQARSEDIAHMTAQALAKAGRTPQAAGSAAGLVARVSIYLALVGPVFSTINYSLETDILPAARAVTVFTSAADLEADVVLSAEGLGLVPFGTPVEAGESALLAALGPPTDVLEQEACEAAVLPGWSKSLIWDGVFTAYFTSYANGQPSDGPLVLTGWQVAFAEGVDFFWGDGVTQGMRVSPEELTPGLTWDQLRGQGVSAEEGYNALGDEIRQATASGISLRSPGFMNLPMVFEAGPFLPTNCE